MNVDAIFQFLFENIFFVIIVVAGLFSFLKRLATEADANRKRQQTAPLPPVSKPFADEGRDELQPQYHQEKPETKAEKNGATEMVDADQSPKDWVPADLPSSRLPKRDPKKRSAPVTVHKSTFHHPTKKQVINGVIWAEILGPPRAKRPYSRRNR